MALGIEDIVGLAGTFLILSAYLLLQIGKLSATQILYQIMNICGCSFLIVSLLKDFNLAAMAMQIAWLTISLIGTLRILTTRPRRIDRSPDRS